MSDHNLLDPSIFATLKSNLEEETQVRDSLTQIVQRLERAVAVAQGHLSRVHSTPRAKCMPYSSFTCFKDLSTHKIPRPGAGAGGRGGYR